MKGLRKRRCYLFDIPIWIIPFASASFRRPSSANHLLATMKPSRFLRRVLIAVGLTAAALSNAGRAASPLFDYDHAAPLYLREVGRETRDHALVRDISFLPVDQPVKAYLVSPIMASSASHPGILYVHWLGEPKTSNRSEFLNEAVALAEHGVVSLLVDTMWAEPQWYARRVPEEDYVRSVRQVIELRRAMDLLLDQPGVDSQRIAFVGHDFGAMYGMIASAQDRRAKTYVFMAAVPRLIDWFLFARQPADLAAYREQLTPLNPVNFVGELAPASLFFQIANQDKYVSPAQAEEFYNAARPRKQMTTYAAGHDLHTPEVAADRVAWLKHELDLKD